MKYFAAVVCLLATPVFAAGFVGDAQSYAKIIQSSSGTQELINALPKTQDQLPSQPISILGTPYRIVQFLGIHSKSVSDKTALNYEEIKEFFTRFQNRTSRFSIDIILSSNVKRKGTRPFEQFVQLNEFGIWIHESINCSENQLEFIDVFFKLHPDPLGI